MQRPLLQFDLAMQPSFCMALVLYIPRTVVRLANELQIGSRSIESFKPGLTGS
jgi:hypothetical protein